MPQVQILQAQPDPGAAAIRSAGEMVNDSIYKKQQVEVMKHELAIKSKLAQTAEEKAMIDRQKIFIDSMQKAFDQGVFKNEKLSQAWVGMMGKHFGQETFEFMAEAGDSLKGFQSPEAEYKSAQAEDLRTSNDPAKQQELLAAKMNAIRGGSTGGLLPGAAATIKSGDVSLNVPLSPNYTDPEASSITKGEILGRTFPRLQAMITKGVLGTNSMARTNNAMRVENGNSLLTSNNPALQEFQSVYNTIRQASLFDEAGKALTGTEKEETLRKLSLTGKSDKTLLEDLQWLVDKAVRKQFLLTGGASASSQAGDMSTLSDEELNAIISGGK